MTNQTAAQQEYDALPIEEKIADSVCYTQMSLEELIAKQVELDRLDFDCCLGEQFSASFVEEIPFAPMSVDVECADANDFLKNVVTLRFKTHSGDNRRPGAVYEIVAVNTASNLFDPATAVQPHQLDDPSPTARGGRQLIEG